MGNRVRESCINSEKEAAIHQSAMNKKRMGEPTLTPM
jgi:hypothetical protein